MLVKYILGQMNLQLYLHFLSCVCKKALLDDFAIRLSALLCVCVCVRVLALAGLFCSPLGTFFHLSPISTIRSILFFFHVPFSLVARQKPWPNDLAAQSAFWLFFFMSAPYLCVSEALAG